MIDLGIGAAGMNLYAENLVPAGPLRLSWTTAASRAVQWRTDAFFAEVAERLAKHGHHTGTWLVRARTAQFPPKLAAAMAQPLPTVEPTTELAAMLDVKKGRRDA